jgi:hypothetical protein
MTTDNDHSLSVIAVVGALLSNCESRYTDMKMARKSGEAMGLVYGYVGVESRAGSS